MTAPRLDQLPMFVIGQLLHRGTIVEAAGLVHLEQRLCLGVSFTVSPHSLDERFAQVALAITQASLEWLQCFDDLQGLLLIGEAARSGFSFEHRRVFVPRAAALAPPGGALDERSVAAACIDTGYIEIAGGAWSAWAPRGPDRPWGRLPHLEHLPLLFRAASRELGVELDDSGLRHDRAGDLALYAEFGYSEDEPAEQVLERMSVVARAAAPFLRCHPALRLLIAARPDEPVASPPRSFSSGDVVAWASGEMPWDACISHSRV